jgi:hypothetical protein
VPGLHSILIRLAGNNPGQPGAQWHLLAGRGGTDNGCGRHHGYQAAATPGLSSYAKRFRVHLDGYNQLPYLIGQNDESPAQ